MQKNNCEFRFIKQISYYETDRMSVVHHSNYIRWFEDARIDFLKKAGMPYYEIEEAGLMIPVLSVSCEYLHPLRFGDTARIESVVTDFNAVKFNVEYSVYNDESNKLCATGKSSHCFVNDAFRPVRIKKDYPLIYNVFMKINTNNKNG